MAAAVVDLRGTLSEHPTKRYQSRPFEAIKALCIHHTVTTAAGSEATEIEGIARGHVKRGSGWPGIGYTFPPAGT